MAASLVRLPFYTELSQSDQDRVMEVVQSFNMG
jgi:dTDP-4-amino-4,6-dideoxygalactose transaminase